MFRVDKPPEKPILYTQNTFRTHSLTHSTKNRVSPLENPLNSEQKTPRTIRIQREEFWYGIQRYSKLFGELKNLVV